MKTTKRIAALLLALALMLGLSSCYYDQDALDEAYQEGYEDGYDDGVEYGIEFATDAIWDEYDLP